MDLNAYCGFSFSKMNNHLHIVETTYTHSNTRIHVQVECIASLFYFMHLIDRFLYKSDSFGRVFTRRRGKKNVGEYSIAMSKVCEGQMTEREKADPSSINDGLIIRVSYA
jgi:SHS2 domain-containing protein